MREKGQTEVAKTLETPVFSRGIEILTEKFKFLGEMLAAMGVPLFDESIQKVVDQFFDQIPEDLAPQTPK